MATLDIDSRGHLNDQLTCTICLQVFRDPKYLPCLHTFCECCISTYISSCVEKDCGIKELKCPVCKQSVVMGETMDCLPSQLASNLPLNHLVMSMLDKQAIRKSEKLCNSCEVNSETVKAVTWCTVCEEGLCKTCDKCHRSFKISSNHEIISLEDLNDDTTAVLVGGILGCESHVGKIVEVYCVDHSTPCCTLCATLSHRKCDNVVSLESVSTDIKQSTKANNLSNCLREKSEHIQSLITNRKENIRLVESGSSKILTDIDDVKDQVVKHLNELADNAKEHVTSSKKNAVISLTDEITELSNLKITVDNWKMIFETCKQHGSDQQCLVEMERIISKNAEQDREIKEMVTELKQVSMAFEHNKLLAELQRNVQSFGDLSVSTSIEKRNFGLSKVNFRSGNIKVLATILVNEIPMTNSERKISGIFVGDVIVLTDRVNKRIVKYNASYVYQSELLFPNEVSDITHMEQDTVAVASAWSNSIYVINITAMTLTKTITTTGNIYGLQFVDGGFVSELGGKLKWISTLGATVEERKINGESFYVHAKGDTYICADGDNAISSFSRDAKKVFTYTSTSLNHCRGIEVDLDGNIYIVGYKSRNIHQITSDGKLIKIFSMAELGIKEPWVLRFKPNSAIFLITSCDSSGKVLICNIE